MKAAAARAPAFGAGSSDAGAPTSADEQLLDSFCLIAKIDKAWCRTASTGPAAAVAGKPPAKGSAAAKSALDVMVLMSQRNLPANTTRRFMSNAHIPEPQGDLSSFHWAPFPTELAGVTSVSPSPSGTRLLVVKNGTATSGAAGASGGASKEGQAVKLEVWGAGRLLQEVHVPPTLHGPVYADGTFEGYSWSVDERRVVYVAEEAPTPKPTFGRRTITPAPAPAPAPVPAPAPQPAAARRRYGAVATPAAAPAPAPSAPAAVGGADAEAAANGSSASSPPGSWKGKGEWAEDWGEQYTGKGRPLLFVLDTVDGTVAKVEGVPEDLSAGQPVWAPAADAAAPQSAIVFVGWPAASSNFHTLRKLGFKYCSNRPSALYAARAPGSEGAVGQPAVVRITSDVGSAFAPRFSPDGSLLAFLSAQASVDTGVHAATNSLHSLPWPAGGGLPQPPPFATGSATEAAGTSAAVPSLELPSQTIIDVVSRAEEAGGFPGLYCSDMIAKPWLADGKTLLLTTAWRSTQAIIAVHVETGRVSRLTPEGPISWALLDVGANVVVAGASTPACPTKLMLGRVNSGWLKQEGWLWSEISPPHVEYAEEVESALKATEFEVIPIAPPEDPEAAADAVAAAVPAVPAKAGSGKAAAAKAEPAAAPTGVPSVPEGAKQPFEAIFVRRSPEVPAAPPPAAGSKVAPAPQVPPPGPLVVVPHGGPHSVTSTNFLMPYAYLCALGYSVLHVNYRGSLGFGEEALQSLPGNIGRQDVEDVLEAIERVVELGYADGSRVAIVGGSHGGFLAAHLIGQFPDRFTTAVLRNPVCNLATMPGVSDIPDWAFVEALGPAKGMASYTEAPTAADLEAFYAASPISHVSKVKVPTLFLLGGQDRRVPPSNGLQYVQALRAQGLDAKVLFFPEDTHGLDKPQTEFEHWLAVASWLNTYLKGV